MNTLWISFILISCYPLCLKIVKNKRKRHKIFITLVFLQLSFLFALRNVSVGVDLSRYFRTYEYARGQNFLRAINRRGDFSSILYYFFNYICTNLGLSYQGFLGIVGTFCTFITCYTIYRYSKNLYISVIIYMSFGIYAFQFSGLRQSISMAFCLIAFCFLREHKQTWFYTYVVVASLFHPTAIVFLPLYILAFKNITKVSVVFIGAFIGGVFLFRNQIGEFLTIIYASEYVGEYESRGRIGTMAVFMIILTAIYLLFLYKKKILEEDSVYLRILIIALMIQMLSSYAYSFTRLNYYYIQLLPLIFSEIIALPKKYKRFVGKYDRKILSVAFKVAIILLCVSLYNTSIIQGTNTFNYTFMWQED